MRIELRCAPYKQSFILNPAPILNCAATANGDEPTLSFDDLVGRGEQRLRYAQCERICGLEVDEQIEFDRRLHGKLLSRGWQSYWCRVRDLNSRPTVYKTAALPLS
jgi:hypothetical protein